LRDVVKPPRKTKAETEARDKEYYKALHTHGVDTINAFLRAEQDEERKRIASYADLAPQLAEKAGISLKLAASLLKPDFANRLGIPDFSLKNNSAEIRRLKERIKSLKRAHTAAVEIGNETIEYTNSI